jgi:AbrB family looped-hinge helix DNA binding protein
MVTASTDIGSNGRIVLPKRVRDALDLKEGDTLFFENISDDELKLRVLRGEDEFLRKIRNPGQGKALDPKKLQEELWR